MSMGASQASAVHTINSNSLKIIPSSERQGVGPGYSPSTSNVNTNSGPQCPLCFRRTIRPAQSRRSKNTLAARHPEGGRRLRESLHSLLEMPLDILFEIFAFLHPLDLLRMTRTTKSFRDTLMSHSTSLIWKRAMATEGLPGCPREMTEPEYAKLAFGTHCYFCLKGRSHIVVWADRKRCCETCFTENYQYDVWTLGLNALPVDAVEILPSIIRRHSRVCAVPQVYFSLRTARVYNKEYSQMSDETQRLKWIEKRLRESGVRRVHAYLCEAWLEKRLSMQRSRRAALKAVHASYVATQHPRATIPNIADFVEMEKFRALIEDTPSEEGTITNLFENAVTEFPALVDNWRRVKNTELVGIMKVERTDAVESTLLLATTFFRCTVCEFPVEYSQILGHSCLTTYWGGNSVYAELGCTPWNYRGNRVSFHRGAFRAAESILRACHVDPETVTTEGLRLSDPLIECLTCTGLGQDRIMMGWFQAVYHVCSHPGVKDVLDQPGSSGFRGCVAAVVEVRGSPDRSSWKIFEQEHESLPQHAKPTKNRQVWLRVNVSV